MAASFPKPIARAELLIRRLAGETFEAFVGRGIASKFWLTRWSSRLEAEMRIVPPRRT